MFETISTEFCLIRFIIITLPSLICCIWIFPLKRLKDKIYYSLFYFFIYIYSGIGWSYDYVDIEYVYYYFLYLLAFSMTLFSFRNKNEISSPLSYDNLEEWVLKKYASWIVCTYLLFCLLELVVPENKLLNLIHPPAPNLSDNFDKYVLLAFHRTFFEALIYYTKSFLFPFYLFSLYRFRKNIFVLFFLFIFPLYIQLCHDSYIGRSEIMSNILVVIIFFYYEYRNLRKWILLGCLSAIPIIAIPLGLYTTYRTTGVFSFEWSSLGQIYETLFLQETSFPFHFNEIIAHDGTMIKKYCEWIITLFLPGCLKSVDAYQFNIFISEYLLNLDRHAPSFFVLLSGLVCESLYIFGKYFFILHAVIMGMLASIPIRFLQSEKESFLFCYLSIFLPYYMARGGTFSGYPFIIKFLLLYILIRYFGKVICKKQNICPDYINNNK